MYAGGFYTTMLGFLGGVAVATLVPLSPPWSLWVLLLACALALVWRGGRGEKGEKKLVLFLALFLLSFSLGTLRVQYERDTAPAAWPSGMSTFEGIVRDPEVREKTTHLYVETAKEKILVISRDAEAVAYGDRLSVTGEVTTPEPFETEFARTFHYDGYLRARGVYHVVFFPEEINIEARAEGARFIAALFSLKHYFMTSLEAVLSPANAALAEGLLLGEKRALGESNETLFRRAGIIHIVVLSGYNVMLVVAFVMFLLSFLVRGRKRYVFGLLAITCFALVVGLGPTVVRASIMAALVLIADALGRQYAVWRALILAAVVMVALSPYILIFDPGFQLSFLATAGLVAAVPYFEKSMVSGVLPLRLRDIFFTTLAAQIAVLPLLLYQIGEFSMVALLVNMLVLPMVPVAMLLAFLAGVGALLWLPLGQLFAMPAGWALSYIYFVAEYFGGMPLAAVAVPPFPFFLVVLAYLCMGAVVVRRAREEKGVNATAGGEGESEQSAAGEPLGSPAAPPPIFFR